MVHLEGFQRKADNIEIYQIFCFGAVIGALKGCVPEKERQAPGSTPRSASATPNPRWPKFLRTIKEG